MLWAESTQLWQASSKEHLSVTTVTWVNLSDTSDTSDTNDTSDTVDSGGPRLWIVTGPNMGGNINR